MIMEILNISLRYTYDISSSGNRMVKPIMIATLNLLSS